MLAAAAALVSGERDRTHGDKRSNHGNIAELWNAYIRNSRAAFQREGGMSLMWELTPTDVALMMALLKIARTQAGAPNADDYVDGAGYLACAFEIAGHDVNKD
jgi:hypothetical protein